MKWSRNDRAHPELERGHEVLFYDRIAPSLPRRRHLMRAALAYEDLHCAEL